MSWLTISTSRNCKFLHIGHKLSLTIVCSWYYRDQSGKEEPDYAKIDIFQQLSGGEAKYMREFTSD